MTAMADIVENRIVDGYFRGGAVGAGGAVNSTAVVKGIWAATTAYAVGDIVVPHALMTGAGGKFLQCTGAGTTASTNTLAVPNPGATLADGTVTWTAVSGLPALLNVYFGLLTAAPSDTGGGTEVSGGAYARVQVACTMAQFAGTQAAASTTASSGTSATTSNNNPVTFPAPTLGWGSVTHLGIYDQPTGGNLLFWSALAVAKTVNAADAAPSFSAAQFTLQFDN